MIPNRFLFILTALILFTIQFIQAQEAVEYRNAVNLSDPSARVTALHKFIAEYPESYYIPGARYYLFSSYLDLGKTDSALKNASQFVNAYPAASRIGAYNDVASLLAEKKVGLDTADVYSANALKIAGNRTFRGLSTILDTRATVLNLLGKPDSALALERKAIIGNEDNPDLLNNLSIFLEGSGKKIEAIKEAARAILMGNYDVSVTNFNKWLDVEKPAKNENRELREKIVNEISKEFLKDKKDHDLIASKSQAAVLYAYTGAGSQLAAEYAGEALKSINATSSIDDKITFTKNYALVLSLQNKNKEALQELKSIDKLVDPWDTDFWYTLGNVYKKTGENKNAEKAFLSGIIAIPAPKLIQALKELPGEKSLSDSDILKTVEAEKKKLEDFNAGHYQKSPEYKNNTVLAELFTGAECPPCAGADEAFDVLSEYYPRSAVVILEYHEHIPGPDPMTNPKTFRRYVYYGGNFGTPTAIIEGKEKITGGGPKFLVANRFNVYQYAIDKFINKTPEAFISGEAKILNDSVKINLDIKSNKDIDSSVTLHIALAEKSINYSGGNGVSKHIFVVRDLLQEPEGIAINLQKNNEKVDRFIDVKEVEKGLAAYLDDPSKDPSWRPNPRFKGWRERVDKINRDDLVIVAWLQNNANKEVIQSFYTEVLR